MEKQEEKRTTFLAGIAYLGFFFEGEATNSYKVPPCILLNNGNSSDYLDKGLPFVKLQVLLSKRLWGADL